MTDTFEVIRTLHGVLHCELGPAKMIFNQDGELIKELYYLEGERVTKQEVFKLVFDKTKALSTKEIFGQ